MLTLQQKQMDPNSEWYRGMLTQFTDSNYELAEACLPYYRNCDPDTKDRFGEFFMYCLAGSFGFEILVIVVWHFATQNRRWQKYQDRLQKVSDRLKKLQENNQGRHQYYKLQPVSRQRAREIYLNNKAQEELEAEKQKAEEKEQKELARQEKIVRDNEAKRRKKKQNQASEGQKVASSAAAASVGPGYVQPGSFQPGAAQAGPGYASAQSGPGYANSLDQLNLKLPKGWLEYQNENGIPYYYNKKTKQRTWEHPALL